MNAQREAMKDAFETARAQMFYGEGAGTRRKLIASSVASKMAKNPAYAVFYKRALEMQDMAQHAVAARKERRRRDVMRAFNRNTYAVIAGKYTGVNAAVLVCVGTMFYLHKSGRDKRIVDSVRARYARYQSPHHSGKHVDDKSHLSLVHTK
jgi:hypothetical protein